MLILVNLIALFVFFTMLFNGGLVPYYILMTQTLHLKNTVFALILPYLVVPFFVLLLRTYFASIPRDLIDAAKMDGASSWRQTVTVVVSVTTSDPLLAVRLKTNLPAWVKVTLGVALSALVKVTPGWLVFDHQVVLVPAPPDTSPWS